MICVETAFSPGLFIQAAPPQGIFLKAADGTVVQFPIGLYQYSSYVQLGYPTHGTSQQNPIQVFCDTGTTLQQLSRQVNLYLMAKDIEQLTRVFSTAAIVENARGLFRTNNLERVARCADFLGLSGLVEIYKEYFGIRV